MQEQGGVLFLLLLMGCRLRRVTPCSGTTRTIARTPAILVLAGGDLKDIAQRFAALAQYLLVNRAAEERADTYFTSSANTMRRCLASCSSRGGDGVLECGLRLKFVFCHTARNISHAV